jgi:Ca2+-binding EF-hand superfamily protein
MEDLPRRRNERRASDSRRTDRRESRRGSDSRRGSRRPISVNVAEVSLDKQKFVPRRSNPMMGRDGVPTQLSMAAARSLAEKILSPLPEALSPKAESPGGKRKEKATTQLILDEVRQLRQSNLALQASHTALQESMRLLVEHLIAPDDVEDEEDQLAEEHLEQGLGDNHAIRTHEKKSKESLQQMALKMFEMLDVDTNNEISIEEAVEFVRRSGNYDAMPDAESLCVKYDANGNGKIDLQEFTLIVTDIHFAKNQSVKCRNAQKNLALPEKCVPGNSGAENTDGGQLDLEDGALSQNKYSFLHFLRAGEAIDPESTWGFYCTITTMLLVLYSAFLIPARLGFNSEKDAGPLTTLLDFVSEVWFIFDIVVNFHMGFEDPLTGQMVMDLPRIRQIYKRSWMPIDCISSVPVKSLTLLLPALTSLSSLKMLRLAKLFRLVKLLKLKALEDMEDSGTLSPSTIRLAKIAFTFIFLVHAVACCYWLAVTTTCVFCEESTFGEYNADCKETLHFGAASFTTPGFCPNVYKTTALGSKLIEFSGHTASLSDRYIFAFYWAIMAMLGDNASPETNPQFIFAVVMSLIGIIVFSTVIGSLSAVLSNLDSAAAAKQDQLDSVNAYLSYRKVSNDLKLRIRAFYKYLWQSGQSSHHQSMFEELPTTLALQLQLALKEDLIVSVPMFHESSAATVLILVKSLEQSIAIPGEAVVKQGNKGMRMYFCVKGRLEVRPAPPAPLLVPLSLLSFIFNPLLSLRPTVGMHLPKTGGTPAQHSLQRLFLW